MTTIIRRLILFVTILIVAFSCEKDTPETIEMEIKLVNDNDVAIDTYEEGDSVLFKFYLLNNLGRDVAYVRPNSEILEFLKVHKKNSSGEYEYIGNPSATFVLVKIIDSIQNNEKKLLGGVPTTNDFNWPVMGQGNYYVGDTFNITIDDELHYYNSRIYFKIE